ncbi:MAG TPA: L-histidine N(alpha)-methyltransferase [Rhodocyclaceae bacterium]|nr:L-histidine N(alpha)-methyltransferase [Rhodocyclaceae bacterium]
MLLPDFDSRERAAAPVTPASDFARAMFDCLDRSPHEISPKYFYDREGSQLFEQICQLPEYYVTRTELDIIRRDVGEMSALIGPDTEVIEFGAGSLEKTRLLLDALESPRRLVAIDISGEHLANAAVKIGGDFPATEVVAIVADFVRHEELPIPPVVSPHSRRIGFFPGSTLGNLSMIEARRFLAGAARLLRGGGLLIGIDLVKDPAVLHAAYNDRAGITAAFNLNVLARANRELAADFRLAGFRHYAFYHPQRQRVEMHLICTSPQIVQLADRRFAIAPGTSIHTENSQKYTVDGFQDLARTCGFVPRALWCDRQALFSIHWLESPA